MADIIKQKLPENNGGYKALNMEKAITAKVMIVYTQNYPLIIRSICAATRS